MSQNHIKNKERFIVNDCKKGILFLGIILMLMFVTGCSSSSTSAKESSARQVVIYTNADKEATAAIEATLNNAGYSSKYVLKTMGTSELGGKCFLPVLFGCSGLSDCLSYQVA